ncbi:uncharacterized protein EAE97_001969 [Botrytis byssoidea]|uniref:Uncharacterized protein n=1 Tax=Botrytis byssoidea TaxID=139641 RepID=A0A9P5M370_9HELO|nr:uncharacterized protein EAE97_001969 [Botrytis byssoidea]KAF7952472.1 hypothetical protein EAE97_001969 [Botrytis byssoidea]
MTSSKHAFIEPKDLFIDCMARSASEAAAGYIDQSRTFTPYMLLTQQFIITHYSMRPSRLLLHLIYANLTTYSRYGVTGVLTRITTKTDVVVIFWILEVGKSITGIVVLYQLVTWPFREGKEEVSIILSQEEERIFPYLITASSGGGPMAIVITNGGVLAPPQFMQWA